MGGYIRFENGVECFINMRAESRRGIEIVTEKGLMFSDFNKFRLWKRRDMEGETPQIDDLVGIPDAIPEAGLNETPYDERGWRYPGNRMRASIQAIVDCLELGVPPRCSGENMAKVLEILIALRESHRRGHAPVKLPLEDRSLHIEPLPYRWINRKEVFGVERYEELMSGHVKEDG